jgi:periplasmic divalent cation tolerance protein
MPEAEHVQVSTTTDSSQAAEALASSAVQARVAACAQVVGPIRSVYWWAGAVAREQEWLVLFKTGADRSEALADHIRRNHSYDVPEIIMTPIIGGDPAYLAWVTAETRTEAETGTETI